VCCPARPPRTGFAPAARRPTPVGVANKVGKLEKRAAKLGKRACKALRKARKNAQPKKERKAAG